MKQESRLYNTEKEGKERPQKGGKKLTKKQLQILGVVLVVIVCVIGVSYAYWRLTLTQTGTNTIASSCLEVSITKEENPINLQKAYPITDEEGLSLTPYTFTITNTCSDYATYEVNLEILNTTTLSEEYVKVALNEDMQGLVSNHQTVEKTLEHKFSLRKK